MERIQPNRFYEIDLHLGQLVAMEPKDLERRAIQREAVHNPELRPILNGMEQKI